jgi:hypothetical protein
VEAGQAPRLPLVSVALCTYNGATHLNEQLDSLWSQTWPRLEVIAVDDASSDGTWDILQRAAQHEPRLRIARNETNLGFAANFERAISLCGGEFIAPCDQDDVWQPSKLQALVQAIDGHLLAYCDSALVDGQGRPLGRLVSDRLRMVEGSDPLAFVFWNCISGHAMLLRRELLAAALPLPAVRYHDWWFAFVAASVGSITYVDQPLVAYRQHAHSQTDVGRLRRQRGDSVARWSRQVDWLQAMAQFPGALQPLLNEMHALAAARQSQWFCPRWWRLLHAQAPRLMAINCGESFTRFGLKQFFGMRWRHLGRGNATPAGT